MKSKKDLGSKIFAFVLLLLGFIASVTIGVTGTVLRIKEFIESQKEEIIIIHNFSEDCKLWFYDDQQQLISNLFLSLSDN